MILIWSIHIPNMNVKQNLMEIFNDIEQGTESWFKLRLGSIGGSSIAAVCAKGKGQMRTNLLYRLAGEILSGQPYDSYKNKWMDRGTELEPEARDYYSAVTGNAVEQVGLIKRAPFKHYSPDGLVGEPGILEIKCVIPSVHIKTVIEDRVPPEHEKQIQWGLACDRQWCDFVSHCPEVRQRPIFIKRMARDNKAIAELDAEADQFLVDLNKIVKGVLG